ncbi:MAG: hypothetical protein CSA42_07780 [Gammaproteobacteria bacterium]|nr:MAG: hypothetical protein CSA42_07780 [Gammaproteobacteria bacterium]
MSTGSVEGALASGTIASSAPAIQKIETKMADTLIKQGINKEVAKNIASGITTATLIGTGETAGLDTSSTATAVNVDSNNRQQKHKTAAAFQTGLQVLMPAHTAYITDNPIGGSAQAQLEYANMTNLKRGAVVVGGYTLAGTAAAPLVYPTAKVAPKVSLPKAIGTAATGGALTDAAIQKATDWHAPLDIPQVSRSAAFSALGAGYGASMANAAKVPYATVINLPKTATNPASLLIFGNQKVLETIGKHSTNHVIDNKNNKD